MHSEILRRRRVVLREELRQHPAGAVPVVHTVILVEFTNKNTRLFRKRVLVATYSYAAMSF